MLGVNGWLGITRTAPLPRPWHVLSPLEIANADDKAKASGATRRPLIVGVTGKYRDVLNEEPPTSERYFRAAFMAACTITHEIGHGM